MLKSAKAYLSIENTLSAVLQSAMRSQVEALMEKLAPLLDKGDFGQADQVVSQWHLKHTFGHLANRMEEIGIASMLLGATHHTHPANTMWMKGHPLPPVIKNAVSQAMVILENSAEDQIRQRAMQLIAQLDHQQRQAQTAVRKDGNPYHDEQGLFTSADNAASPKDRGWSKGAPHEGQWSKDFTTESMFGKWSFVAEKQLMEKVRPEIDAYTPPENVPTIGSTDEKWIAISALQKAIRTGDSVEAQRLAVALANKDSWYLFNRMGTVSMEDVGIADPTAQATILSLMWNQDLRKEVGAGKLAGYMAQTMAEAPKNRLLTQLTILGEEGGYDLAGKSAEDLQSIALDKNQDVGLRAAALASLGKQAGESKDWSTMYDTAQKMGVPPSLAYVYKLGGYRRVAGLFAQVPLAWEIASSSKDTKVVDNDLPERTKIGGFPSSAYDMYSGLGKRALAYYAKANPDLKQFFEDHQLTPGGKLTALGESVFAAEGGKLGRELVFDQSAGLDKQMYGLLLKNAGLSQDDGDKLMGIVANSLPTLNKARGRIYQYWQEEQEKKAAAKAKPKPKETPAQGELFKSEDDDLELMPKISDAEAKRLLADADKVPVKKENPYHDAEGKFTTAAAAAGGGYDTKIAGIRRANPGEYEHVQWAEQRQVTGQVRVTDLPVEEVPVDRLVATQDEVNQATVDDYRRKLRAGAAGEIPAAIEYGGQYFISDGHHRALASVLEGASHIRMHVEHLKEMSRKTDYSGMAGQLNDAVLGTGRAMVDIAANLFTSRLVSYGFLSQAQNDGIDEYQVSAILDQHTCPVCQYMNGKTFQVGAALGRLDQVLRIQDPNELKQAAPWLKQDHDSLHQLHGQDAEDLQAAGFDTPPYHPVCRCILVPAGSVTETVAPEQMELPGISVAPEGDEGDEQEPWLYDGVLASAKSLFDDMNGDLTPAESDAVAAYASNGFDAINSGLRAGGELEPSVSEEVDLLDSAIDKSEAPKDMVVFRGLKNLQSLGIKDPEALVGSEITDDGFVSTMVSQDDAIASIDDTADEGVLVQINVPQGAPALAVPTAIGADLSESDLEVLLARGSRFKITDAHQDTIDGKNFWVLSADMETEKSDEPRRVLLAYPSRRYSWNFGRIKVCHPILGVMAH